MNFFLSRPVSIHESVKSSDKDEIVKKYVNVKTLKDLYGRIEALFNVEPELERDIQIHLTSIVSNLYHAALNNTDGFCFKFAIPIVQVQSILKKLKLPPSEVEEVFRNDWKYPKNTHMYSDKNQN